MRKAVVALIIVILIGAGGFWYVNQQQQAAAQSEFEIVREATVERKPLALAVSATGSIEPEALVALSFGSAGTVADLRVSRNEFVQAGDLLAVLDTNELELSVQQAADALRIQELTLQQRLNAQPTAARTASADADIASAAGSLLVSEGNLAAAQADVRAAQGNLSVVRANYQTALSDIEAARANLDVARAQSAATALQIDSAEANLAAARSQVTAAQAGVQVSTASRSQLTSSASGAEIEAARAELLQVQQNKKAAQDFYDDVFTCYEQDDGFLFCPKEALQDQATDRINIANQQVAAAQSRLNLLTGSSAGPADLAVADANIQSAQTQVGTAQNNVTVAEVGVTSAGANLLASQGQVRVAEVNVQRAQAAANALLGQITQAQASVERAEAAVMSAEGNVAIAEANLARARAAYDQLFEPASEDELAILEAQVASTRTSLSAAQLRLDQAQISAPIDGIVANVQIEDGEQVTPGAPVITIINEDAYHLEVNVDEIDIEQIAVGQTVRITLDAVDEQSLSGQVADIAPTSAGGTGVVTYLVTINIDDNSGIFLRAGLTATAEIITNQLEDVLVVPNWAVRLDRETGTAFVNVLRAGSELAVQIEELPIEIGLRNDQFSEVVSGIEAGEVVVLTNQREGFSLFGGN